MVYARSAHSFEANSPLYCFILLFLKGIRSAKVTSLIYASFAFTIVLSLPHGWTKPAQASSIALSFDIPGESLASSSDPDRTQSNEVNPAQSNHNNTTTKANSHSSTSPITPSLSGAQPLPIPQKASSPPTQNITPSTAQPANVYGGLDGIHLAQNTPETSAPLPPPPPGALPSSRILSPTSPSSFSSVTAQVPNTNTHKNQNDNLTPQPPSDSSTASVNRGVADASFGLQFITDSPDPSQVKSPTPESAPQSNGTSDKVDIEETEDLSWIFDGGSDSLVARTIGSAEGTRHANGERTQYYRGHTDPGNGVWNLGTFSYQHGANSPEEADAKQLARLQRQGKVIDQKADKADLDLDLIETLNALDLANQSPAAAMNRGGYIDRMVQAQDQGLTGTDAILWARTNSYRYPDSQRWNAPGLGNTLQGVTRDQRRRMQAIESALEHFQQEHVATETPVDDSESALASDSVTPSSAHHGSLNFSLTAQAPQVDYTEAP